MLSLGRHDPMAETKYANLRKSLRDQVGITELAMDGIIKALSTILLLGNVGFKQENGKIECISRKFHSFPEGFEICEDLMEIDSGEWSFEQVIYLLLVILFN